MTASSVQAPVSSRVDDSIAGHSPARRLGTETKASFKTSELLAYLTAAVGVLLASFLVGSTDDHDDYFLADKAWFYVTLLTIGYLVSRGLAKSGSREHYDAR